MEVPPPVRYVPRRGKNLAYRAYGAGRRVVLSVLEMPTHLDLMWTDPHWIRQAARLAERCRVISFQQMGLGLSDAIDRVPTLEEQAEDIAAVMDAEGVASAIMCGTFSTAMPVVLLAANAPERVEALVLQDPYAQGWRSAPYEEIDGFTPAEARGFALAVEAALTRWGEGRLADLVDSVTAARNRTAVAMLERCSATPATAVALYEAAATSDVRATLPLVRAPTRVLHRPTFGLPESASRVVAGLMPNATYHLLPPTQPHTTYAEALAPVFDHLLEVVDGASHTPGGHRQLATILFTDVVGSTETARATGDLRWDRLLERHEIEIRGRVEAEGGRVVQMIGDGSLSVFSGPAAAIRAAQRVCQDARALGLEVRAGLHTGECNRRPSGDISGLAVHIAARVGSAASPGEVWVSRTVRDLLGGSGVQLVPRGTHHLKGIAEPWDLFCVAGEDLVSTTVEDQHSAMRTSDRILVSTARHAPGILRAINAFGSSLRGRGTPDART